MDFDDTHKLIGCGEVERRDQFGISTINSEGSPDYAELSREDAEKLFTELSIYLNKTAARS